MGGFSDFFRTIFGGGGSAPRRRRLRRRPGRRTRVRGDLRPSARSRRAGRRDDGRADARRGPAGTTRTLQIGDGTGRARGRGQDPARRARRLARARGRRRRGRARGGPGRPVPARAVLPHPLFERKGDDLETTVTVPLTTAVLGGEMTRADPRRAVSHQGPAGDRGRATFRLRGHGLPELGKAATSGATSWPR